MAKAVAGKISASTFDNEQPHELEALLGPDMVDFLTTKYQAAEDAMEEEARKTGVAQHITRPWNAWILFLSAYNVHPDYPAKLEASVPCSENAASEADTAAANNKTAQQDDCVPNQGHAIAHEDATTREESTPQEDSADSTDHQDDIYSKPEDKSAKEALPKLNQSDKSKIISVFWKSRTDEEKTPWYRLATLAAKRHKIKYPDYVYQPGRHKSEKMSANAKPKVVSAKRKRERDDSDAEGSSRGAARKTVKRSSGGRRRVPQLIQHYALGWVTPEQLEQWSLFESQVRWAARADPSLELVSFDQLHQPLRFSCIFSPSTQQQCDAQWAHAQRWWTEEKIIAHLYARDGVPLNLPGTSTNYRGQPKIVSLPARDTLMPTDAPNLTLMDGPLVAMPPGAFDSACLSNTGPLEKRPLDDFFNSLDYAAFTRHFPPHFMHDHAVNQEAIYPDAVASSSVKPYGEAWACEDLVEGVGSMLHSVNAIETFPASSFATITAPETDTTPAESEELFWLSCFHAANSDSSASGASSSSAEGRTVFRQVEDQDAAHPRSPDRATSDVSFVAADSTEDHYGGAFPVSNVNAYASLAAASSPTRVATSTSSGDLGNLMASAEGESSPPEAATSGSDYGYSAVISLEGTDFMTPINEFLADLHREETQPATDTL